MKVILALALLGAASYAAYKFCIGKKCDDGTCGCNEKESDTTKIDIMPVESLTDITEDVTLGEVIKEAGSYKVAKKAPKKAPKKRAPRKKKEKKETK